MHQRVFLFISPVAVLNTFSQYPAQSRHGCEKNVEASSNVHAEARPVKANLPAPQTYRDHDPTSGNGH